MHKDINALTAFWSFDDDPMRSERVCQSHFIMSNLERGQVSAEWLLCCLWP